MRSALASSSCSQAKSTISSYLDTYEASAHSFGATAFVAESQANGGMGYIDTYAVYYRQIAIYSIYALVVGGAALAILFQVLGSVCGMKFAIVVNNIVFFILIVLAAVTMTLAAVSADFCMDPNGSIARILPVSGTTKSVVTYYTTCSGTNPLNQYISNANSSILFMNTTLTTLLSTGSPCASDPYLKTLRSEAMGVLSEMQIVQREISCAAVQPIWDAFLTDGLCGHFYAGWYSLWLVFLVTSFLLFILQVISSVAYQYFDFRIEFGGGGYYPQDDAWAVAGPTNPPPSVAKYY